MSLEIAFIGYGEVGQRFSRELLAAGPNLRIAAFDTLFDDPIKGPALTQYAVEAGVRAQASSAEACRGCEIIISAVTADAAVEAAEQAAHHLRPSQTYVDLNSVSPATRMRVGE